jgi:hypothetical protein
VAIPPDVVKSRYQGAPHGTYSSFIDCARKTIAADGAKALFKGAGPAMLRACEYAERGADVPQAMRGVERQRMLTRFFCCAPL